MHDSQMPIVLPVIVISALFMVIGLLIGFARLCAGDFRRSELAKLDLPDEHPEQP